MRKLLLTAACLAMSSFGFAQEVTYTDNLVVTINEVSTEPMETTVTVQRLEDGNINFLLSNFVLVEEGNEIPVGNIELNNIGVTEENGYETFTFSGITTISEGDLDVDFWLGPALEEVPIEMTGKMTDEQLHVTIDIDMTESLGQFIYVEFGSDFTDEGGDNEEDDDEAAITSVKSAANVVNGIYDLSGRRVQSVGKAGIYIVNGKKMVLK